MDFIFDIIIIIMSAVVHEVSHGLAARALGDKTAQYAGRLTLNPLAHIDLYGSILMPLMLWFLSGGTFLFASAKPVPYNPYNLKNQQWGPAAVGAAGPLTNLCIAILFALFVRALDPTSAFTWIFARVVIINCSLAIFNLVPVPPLDGSKILLAVLPPRFDHYKIMLERYGFYFLLILVFFFGHLIAWPVEALARLLLGA